MRLARIFSALLMIACSGPIQLYEGLPRDPLQVATLETGGSADVAQIDGRPVRGYAWEFSAGTHRIVAVRISAWRAANAMTIVDTSYCAIELESPGRWAGAYLSTSGTARQLSIRARSAFG